MKMQIPKTGNIIVDKAIEAKDISRTGNQVLDSQSKPERRWS
jgi:hypothetical protein